MVFHSFAITTPANTAEASAKHTKLQLNAGVITDAGIFFPPGCAGLLKLRVLHDGAHLWPARGSDYIAADDFTIPIRSNYALRQGSSTLDAWTWNEDESYSHALMIWLDVLAPDEVDTLARQQAVLIAQQNLFLLMSRYFNEKFLQRV